ncbi:adenosylcobinamide-GDP ribazoletransferase [Fluviibacterium sp. DFM31]|uniref:Adenosylcobinamide-GDP ribazoletransferase n=1 Tax=Meridianimarinicoccus marinus TaxID=3231483 RepID=A0ABV3L8I4_9RHOB
MTAPRPALLDPADPALALGLLTRLPVPVAMNTAQRRGARAAWAYPLAGLVVGGLAALLMQAALWAGLPEGLSAALALGLTVVLTGAMHEDGLADCADGFWGGFARDRRLEIMHDSRIGTYGVLALILLGLLRWQGLAELARHWPVLLAVGMLSRAAMVVVWAALPPARADGLARSLGQPRPATAAVALGLAIAGAWACLDSSVMVAALATAAAAVAVALLARAKIGGQTGDVLGATQQIAEVAALLSLTVLLT